MIYKGKWVKVTDSSSLKVGDIVRYKDWQGQAWSGGVLDSQSEDFRCIKEIDSEGLAFINKSRWFDGPVPMRPSDWTYFEKWVPLEENPVKKIDKKTIEVKIIKGESGYYYFRFKFPLHVKFRCTSDQSYKRKSDAVRALKSVCKALGFDYIIKEYSE